MCSIRSQQYLQNRDQNYDTTQYRITTYHASYTQEYMQQTHTYLWRPAHTITY